MRLFLSVGFVFSLGACSVVMDSSATKGQRNPKTAPMLGGVSSFSAPLATFSTTDKAHGYFECKTSNESSWSVCSSPYDLSDLLPERGDEITLQVRSSSASGKTGPVSEKIIRRGLPNSTVNEDVLVIHVLEDDSYLIGGSFTNRGGVAVDDFAALRTDGSYFSIFEDLNSGAVAYAVATQSDDKTLIGGFFYSYGETNVARNLIRLNVDGSLDTTFNTNAGIGFDQAVNEIVVQDDGKILVGGAFTSYNGNAAVPDNIMRLNADGTEDTSFSTDAGVGANGEVFAIAVQSDGKILVGGNFTSFDGNAASPDFLVRLNADGTEDASFRTSANGGFDGAIYNVALQGDDKIVLTGGFNSYAGDSDTGYGIARLNANGTEDASFRTSANGGFNASTHGLAIQSDGKILVGGEFTEYAGDANSPRGIIRLNSDGTEDTAFRNNVGEGLDSPALDILIQGDGKILASGYFVALNGDVSAPNNIIRLNSDGTEDSEFSAKVGVGFGEESRRLAMRSDDVIICVGSFKHFGAKTSGPKKIARFNSSGVEDTTFHTNAGTGFDFSPEAIASQSDGKILVGGEFTAFNDNAATPDKIVRLNANGTEDTAFSTNAGSGFDGSVSAIGVQADGKIVVSGGFTSYNGDAGVPDSIIRLNANGTVDTSFSANAGTGLDALVTALSIQSDGKILIGGHFTSYDGDASLSNYIARLNADGTIDTTFNTNVGSSFDSYLEYLTLQPDGKILASGWFEVFNGNDTSNGIARLNADGTSDVAFNANVGTEGGSGFMGIAVHSDGKIFAGGWFESYNGNGSAPHHFMGINADGTENTAFSANAGEGVYDWIETVAVDSKGRVMVGGWFTHYAGKPSPRHFIRLDQSGNLLD
jgi:uncharacterized delta-60 repeat protein